MGPKSGDVAAIEKTYKKFADPDDPEVISMDGVEALCKAIGITDVSEDVRALVLCHKLGSCTIDNAGKPKPGCIKHDEFVNSMKAMGKSSVADLAALLPTLDTGFMEANEFKDFFLFVHKFSREENTQKKFLDKAFACALLPIVLDNKRAPHLDSFIQFLETLPDSVTITADQWSSFLHFNDEVLVDLTGYDAENGAWPLILDEYVEYLQAKLAGK
jgi:DCN1-like protein 4/5